MTEQTQTPAPRYDAYPFDLMAIIRLAIIGLVTGALGWLLYLGVAQYFVEPVFCRNADAFGACQNGGTIAWVSAHIVVMAAAVAVMARMAIYRPLLIGIGVFAALWAAHSWLGVLPWYWGAIWQGALFAAGFAVFGWLARLTNFLAALVLSLLLVVAARLVLMNS